MTLHQLKVFMTVAKIKSFTRAAERLGVRQPSVSLVIKDLEQDLEVRLFEKLGHKINLTAAGELLLQDADDILAKAAGLKERIGELKGLKKGRLAVGASPGPAASFFPFAAEQFKREYAWAETTLRIDISLSLEKSLLNGELDLAIVGRLPNSPLIISELFSQEDIVAIASPKHPLAKEKSVPLMRIAREAIVTEEKGWSLERDLLEERFAKLGVPFTPHMELSPRIGSRDAIRYAVAGGLGIGFITGCHVQSDLAAGRLKILKVPDLKLKRSSYIAVHKSRQKSPLVQAFIKVLKRYKKEGRGLDGKK
ncbi:MAG TPA: LysR family transcriptional regulator [Candidatus Binatia bacterium]|jgi:DNA-binding transcriptional LysR family regulator